MNKDIVIAALSEPKQQQDFEREELIKNITDDKDFLRQQLLELEQAEVGGQVAIAGFYYQFLVSIEYIIEMLDGFWDFVAVELHEDIVVGKENEIKFIQVKTSKESHKAISQTELLKRTPKSNQQPDILYTDSWIDKLLTKAKLFPKSSGITSKFELVSSYNITGTSADLSQFLQNKNFNAQINDDDDVFKILSKPVYTKGDDKLFDYESECGEPLKDILARFYIRKHTDLLNIEEYASHIIFKFNKKIGEGITMSSEDLHWLVGWLMDKCRTHGNVHLLYIDRTEAEELRQKISDRVLGVAGETTRRYESKSVIQQIFDTLHEEFKSIDLYEEIKNDLLGYQEHLLEWLSKGGTIRELLNRYVDGRNISTAYTMNEQNRNERLLELFKTCFLLIIVHEDLTRLTDEHTSLVVKEIKKQKLSFLSLSPKDNLEKAIKKIRDIFSDIHSSLDILLDPPDKIILQGFFRERNNPTQVIEITKPNMNIEHFRSIESLKEVPILLEVIPGGELKEEVISLFQFNNIVELKTHLTDTIEWIKNKEE